MTKQQVEQEKAMRQRIEKRLDVLRAVRDGKSFSKADAVLRPLLFGSLITVKYLEGTNIINSVSLTDTGKLYLSHYEKDVKRMASV